ncbi:MAG TPA: NADP-dependent succinic semialdehyde dehydrogenase [Acidimicrobiia bacterium]|nr:NADP-dependent succinic semialdehyde dehydrogenase [Acidimicrobiia bacterium]
MTIATINPATGHTVKTFDAATPEEVDRQLERAIQAFGEWRSSSFATRGAVCEAAAGILDAEADELGALMTLEMGKTLGEAKAEVAKCARAFRFYAAHAEEQLAEQPADASAVGARRAAVRFQPLGPVLAVMPWNFPLWQVTRFAAPNLMAGNVGLLKHASNVPQTALAFEDVLRRAGAAEGVFQTLLIGSDMVAAVLTDPRVRAATVTGSNAAGQSVAQIAGEETKKTVLELGGSDPFVVLPSADVQAAVKVGVKARCQNNGQSCIAAKRFIVHAGVAEEFQKGFVDAMRALKVGDPTQPATAIGPLATKQSRATVAEQVGDAVAKGAKVLCGGEVPEGDGWYYPPTVVTGITSEMRMHHEEVFGPVAQLYVVASLDEAIAVANDTPFGLGANVWTQDPAEQERSIAELEAGMVFVNGYTISFPELPFGGVKASGYGRELGTTYGIREFCNTKTVWIG